MSKSADQPKRIRSTIQDERAARLRALVRWWEARGTFIPTSWAVHELGISRQAISAAKGRAGRRRMRVESLTLADGTVVELVNIHDVARLIPHGGVYHRADPLEPIPHPQALGDTMTAAGMINAGNTEEAGHDAAGKAKTPIPLPKAPPPKRTRQTGSNAKSGHSGASRAPKRGGKPPNKGRRTPTRKAPSRRKG